MFSPSNSREQRAFNDEIYDWLGGRAPHVLDTQQSPSNSRTSAFLSPTNYNTLVVNGYTIEPGAYLSYADLYEADLSNADLRQANLYNAYLESADLRYADLSGAHLNYAVLVGANLRNADLSGADLSYADLD